MNNNRNNNRRRGRGNNRQQGGQQLNRIDSRARGNAQQLLDKYKKLAHDAHLNGDRVQEEYYLQFADHYFRVLADQKARQDESRQRREGGSQDGSERPRNDDQRSRYDDEDSDDSDERGDYQQDRHASRNDDRSSNDDSSRDDDRSRDDRSRGRQNDDGDSEDQDGDVYEPAENPFVRETRSQRAPAKPRAPRRKPREANGDDEARSDDSRETGMDPSVLPPSIGSSSEQTDEEPAAEAKPRRRTRKPRATDGSDEALEAVS